MSDQPPKINEIVALLNKHAPAVLDDLRTTYPEDAQLLRVGEIAGRTDKQTQLRAAAAVQGLRVGIAQCEELLPEIKNKLRSGNKLQLTGQLLALAGGASVFSLLALDYPVAGKYAAAILTLLGAVTSVLAQHVARGAAGADGGLLEFYRAAVECHLSARESLEQIEPWVKSNFSGPPRSDSIARANEICLRIMRLEAEAA
jgi:hypothetical protein